MGAIQTFLVVILFVHAPDTHCDTFSMMLLNICLPTGKVLSLFHITI